MAVADRLTATTSTAGTWGRVGGMGGGPDVIELLVWGLQVAVAHQAPTVFCAPRIAMEACIAASPQSLGGMRVHLSKPTLLIVDDDNLMLETLRRLLSHFGFDVIAHDDSVAALASLQQRSDIAMMLCDYDMPELNGEELARAAKRRFPRMPVFILSGSYPPGTLGGQSWDAWFLKGAPITELIRKLNAVLPIATAAMKGATCVPDGEKRHDDSVAVS